VQQYLEKAREEFDHRWHEPPKVRAKICATFSYCSLTFLFLFLSTHMSCSVIARKFTSFTFSYSATWER